MCEIGDHIKTAFRVKLSGRSIQNQAHGHIRYKVKGHMYMVKGHMHQYVLSISLKPLDGLSYKCWAYQDDVQSAAFNHLQMDIVIRGRDLGRYDILAVAKVLYTFIVFDFRGIIIRKSGILHTQIAAAFSDKQSYSIMTNLICPIHLKQVQHYCCRIQGKIVQSNKLTHFSLPYLTGIQE